MSVRVMSWVLEHSRSKPVQRLVLLVIADCCNDLGAEAYPSMATLMRKTALSERGVRNAITGLEAIGELVVHYKAGPHGCNRYRVLMADPASRAGYDLPDDLDPAPHAGSTEDGDPAPYAGNPVRGAGKRPTRHVVHPARRAADPAPGAEDPAPGAEDPARRAENPARRAPDPSEPSRTIRDPSESATHSRPDVDRVCEALADRIASNGSKRPTVTQRWRTSARLMIDTDGRTVDQVLRAIDWCQADEFWRANVLSMPKLRQHFDRLRLAAQRQTAAGARASPARDIDWDAASARADAREAAAHETHRDSQARPHRQATLAIDEN